MITHSIKTKILALFVVAFVCLNAGGAVCVTYCQTFEITAEESEHCPLKKTEDHCDKGASEPRADAIAFGGDELDCCPMTVSFFAGPIEKASFDISPIVATLVVKTTVLRRSEIFIRTFTSAFDYRGPPPLDRRVDRIKHRLLLI